MTLQNSDDLGAGINSDGFSLTGGLSSPRTFSLIGGNLPVSLSSPVSNQVLQFNGTNWINANITGVQGLTQRLYVDKSGNDTTGNPYLTIPAALASITDASLSKVYTVLVGAGTYSNNFSMPANVFIEGIDVVATAISGTVDINNSSWNTAGSPQMLSGFANLTFLGTTTSTFDFSTQANNEAGGLYFWNTRIQTPLVFNGQNATNNNQVVIENCKLNGGTITINGMAGAQINNTAGNNNSSVYVNALSAAGASCNLNNSTVDGTISVTGTNASYPVILNLNDAGVTSTTVLTANGSGVIINATVDSIPSLSRQTFGSGVTLNYNNPIYISTVNGSTGINVGTTAGNGGGTATLSLGTSGVTAGTYPFSTTVVDAYGRVTSATAGTPVTSIVAGSGLSGGTITSTGTLSLASIAGSTLLGNSTSGSAVPIATSLTSNLQFTSGSLDLGTSLTPAGGGQFTINGTANYGLLHLVSTGTNNESSISYRSSNVGSNGSGAWDMGVNVVPSIAGTGNFSLFNSGLGSYAFIVNASNNNIGIGMNGTGNYPLDVDGIVNASTGYYVAGTAERLNNLADVNVGTAPAIGNFLIFSNSLNKWTAGTFLDYSSTGTSTTTSTTQQNKVNGTTPTLAAGQYLISYSFDYAYSNLTRTFVGQLYIDGVLQATINNITNTAATAAGAVANQTASGFIQASLSAGTHTYALSFASSNTADTASIWNAYVRIQEVD